MANFAQAFTEWAARKTNTPENFLSYAAISVCAAALENRVYVDMEWGRTFPSCWIAFVGSSEVRKSTAVNLACDLLIAAKQDIELPQDFSREALVEHLSHRPHGLLRWSEMGMALESFSKDYNAGVLSTLTDIWDSRANMTRLTKSAGLVQIKYPALSILAAGKLRWLQEFVKPRQIGGGFIGRWMFVLETKNQGYRPLFSKNGSTEAGRIQRQSLVEHLRMLAQFEGGEMAPGAGGEVLDTWLEGHEGRWSDEEDPAEFSKRATENIIKLAIGIQACRGPSSLYELDPNAVTQAIAYWSHTFDCGRKVVDGILGHSKESDEIDKVLLLIRRAGTIAQSALLRQTRMKAKTLYECTETLRRSHLITEDFIETSGPGRKPVQYTYMGPK